MSGSPSLKPIAALDGEALHSGFWPQRWWQIVDFKVGIVPLPVFVLLLALIAGFTLTGRMPSDLPMAIVLLAMGGFTCAEIGKRLPVLRNIGAAAILATFIPSALAYYHLLPAPILASVTEFTKVSNFLYLFIAAIIVGSILGMDRRVLIQGFVKIFVPLGVGSIARGDGRHGGRRGDGHERLSYVLLRGRPDHGRRRGRGRDPAVDRLLDAAGPGAGRSVRAGAAAGDDGQPHRHPACGFPELRRQALPASDRRGPAAAAGRRRGDPGA